MTSLLFCAAIATVGVEVGWQPLAGGGHEYTIQIEPQLVDMLKSHDVVSEVPPQLDVRRYRLTVGTAKLARVDGDRPAPREAADTGVAQNAPAAAAPNDDIANRYPESAAAPRSLPKSGGSRPLADTQPVVHQEGAEQRTTDKPSLDGEAGSAIDLNKPWVPFLIAAVLLCCSLGANIYLAWIAWDARSRYRQAVTKVRPATS